jgi:uncharacterized cupredoxin-like copper-binding protein
LTVAVVVGAVFSSLTACGDDSSTVSVELQEFSLNPSEGSAPAGEVTFELNNVGQETHEFVVLKTDLEVLDLPTADDGSVDEEGSGIEVVDEVEDIPAGESEELAVDLEEGRYVLICNIVEEEGGEPESHYQEGMRTAFTAE